MRISRKTGDRGYCNPYGWNVTVRLDGVVQPFVLVADEDAGYVVRPKFNAGGVVMFDAALETYESETVYGRVIIQRQPSRYDSVVMGRAFRRT